MASSPSKRRKLSPEPSIPKSAPNTPSRLPGPRDAIQTSINRPSFASPTKASISRHTPQLLARPRSAGPGEQRSSSKENELPTATLFVTPSKNMDVEAGMPDLQNPRVGVEDVNKEARPEAGASVSGQTTPQGRAARSAGGSLSAPPRRRSRTPGKPISKGPDSADRQAKSGRANQAHQSMLGGKATTPVPFRSAGLRGSPIPSQAVKALPATGPREPEEPELPLTPVQRGLADPVVTTPPSGIHDTPSKRPKRPRAAKAKPSPLKSQQTAEAEPDVQAESESERAGKRRKASEVASRHLVPIDPHAEKKKLRDQLLREVQELQADVTLAEQENDRHRRFYVSGKGPSEPPNPDEIISLLVRSAAASAPKAPPPKPTSIFKSIASFLPFARRPRPSKAVPPKDTPIPSYLPIPLEDQLPHLQLFTPLTLSSTITILPSKPSTSTTTSPNPIFQNHTITLSAASGLFSARLNMIVDTSRLSVSSLSINTLDPSADAELGRWARERASGKGILGRDVSAICWAMARWFEVATKRAKFWSEVERELGSDEGRRKSTARLKAIRKRKKRGGTRPSEDLDEGHEEGRAIGESTKMKWTRKQLLPQMRRTSLVLTGDGVELRIEWNIVFDWTGEAESIISASAKVPSSCKYTPQV